jgi:hypothetical protein
MHSLMIRWYTIMIILIDTSGSMNDGTPPLFGEVQRVSQDFVRAIQEGSNLILYSLTQHLPRSVTGKGSHPLTKIRSSVRLGRWKPRGKIRPCGILYATVYRKWRNGKERGQHIQLLISYTDGKDNYSRVDPLTCLNKYTEMQRDGYSYWIYNAIGGVGIPDESIN